MDNMNTSCFPLALAALKSAKSANDRYDDVAIKSFTYTGNGETTNTIQFPITPKLVLLIVGGETSNEIQSTVPPLAWGVNAAWGMTILSKTNPSGANNVFNMFTSYNGNILTIIGDTANRCMNANTRSYTVYYI